MSEITKRQALQKPAVRIPSVVMKMMSLGSTLKI